MILFGSSAMGSVAAAFTWECIKIKTGRGFDKICTPLDDEYFKTLAAELMALPEDERETRLAAMARGIAQTARMAMLHLQTAPAA
jgi:hypothetical protein